jgi:hypothetical protein
MEASGETYCIATLPPGKNPRNPLYKRLGEFQIGFGSFGKKKDILPLMGFRAIICHLVF